MAIDRFFQRFTIARQQAGDGRVPGAYADVSTEYGFLQPSGSTAGTVGEGLQNTDTYVLFTYAFVNMLQGDRVTYNGARYTVNSIAGNDGISGLGRHKEYELVRVDNG